MGRFLSLRHFDQGPLGQATGLHRLGQSKQQMSRPWGLAGQGEPRASAGRVARKRGEARQKERQVRGDSLLGGQGTTSPQAVRLPHFSVKKMSLQGACLLCRGQVAVLCESGVSPLVHWDVCGSPPTPAHSIVPLKHYILPKTS